MGGIVWTTIAAKALGISGRHDCHTGRFRTRDLVVDGGQTERFNGTGTID